MNRDKDRMLLVQNQSLLHRTEDRRTRTGVRLQEERVRLNQLGMAETSQSTRQNNSPNHENICNERKFEKKQVVEELLTVAANGGKGSRTYYDPMETVLSEGKP